MIFRMNGKASVEINHYGKEMRQSEKSVHRGKIKRAKDERILLTFRARGHNVLSGQSEIQHVNVSTVVG